MVFSFGYFHQCAEQGAGEEGSFGTDSIAKEVALDRRIPGVVLLLAVLMEFW